MRSQKAAPFLLFLNNMEKMDHVAFLADITFDLKQLKLKLQGKDTSVCDLMTDVHAFKENSRSSLKSCFTFLLSRNKRFDSFTLREQLHLLIQNPFLIPDIREFSRKARDSFRWANAGSLQLEPADLQTNVLLKGQVGEKDAACFWIQMVSETTFPTLRKVALHILSMFGSTYCCEAAFSTMNMIKNKDRSRLTNEHLDMCLRMALSPFKPRFKILAGQAHSHFSH